ncbi:hypothetical protein [Microbacterium gilvum]|uniref:hypothetical protein n=1 Tax=Microbacterium gilvum TaxID=1336204 RepID=UPI0031E8698E
MTAPAPAGAEHPIAEERRRMRRMLTGMLVGVPAQVDLSVVEGPAIAGKFRGKADERAGLRWMLIDQLLARGPVAVVTPNTRELLAVGRGFARGTSQAVRKGAVLDRVRATFPEVQIPDHNAADAVALAAAGAHALGMPMTYSAKQISAHAGIAWPVKVAG